MSHFARENFSENYNKKYKNDSPTCFGTVICCWVELKYKTFKKYLN